MLLRRNYLEYSKKSCSIRVFFLVVHEDRTMRSSLKMRSLGAICLQNIRRPSVCLAGDRTRGRKGRKVKEETVERYKEREEAGGWIEKMRMTDRMRTTMERRDGGEDRVRGQKEIKVAFGEEHFSLDRGGAATV